MKSPLTTLPKIRAWIKKIYGRLGLTTRVAIVVLAITIPDWIGRGQFWYTAAHWAWPFIKSAYASPSGKTALIILAFVAMWLDQRRTTRKRQQSHDPETLKGRTLAFCDDLRRFQKELGPEPEVVWKAGNSASEFNQANMELGRREAKMHHGFHLQFRDRAIRLFHEHGQALRELPDLGVALDGRVDTNQRLNGIIERYEQLAEMSDS